MSRRTAFFGHAVSTAGARHTAPGIDRCHPDRWLASVPFSAAAARGSTCRSRCEGCHALLCGPSGWHGLRAFCLHGALPVVPARPPARRPLLRRDLLCPRFMVLRLRLRVVTRSSSSCLALMSLRRRSWTWGLLWSLSWGNQATGLASHGPPVPARPVRRGGRCGHGSPP